MTTYQSKRRYSPARKVAMLNGLKRSWKEGSHHQRFHCQPVDADTMRERARWDRKGQHCASFSVHGTGHIIRHSSRRTDSYDVYSGTKLVCSGGRAKVGLFIGSLLP